MQMYKRHYKNNLQNITGACGKREGKKRGVGYIMEG